MGFIGDIGFIPDIIGPIGFIVDRLVKVVGVPEGAAGMGSVHCENDRTSGSDGPS